jgi:hypothetical protein
MRRLHNEELHNLSVSDIVGMAVSRIMTCGACNKGERLHIQLGGIETGQKLSPETYSGSKVTCMQPSK